MLVKNRSWSPRILSVAAGKEGKTRTIALPGRGSTEISEAEAASPEIQRLLASGELFLIPGTAGSSEKATKKGAEDHA